MIEVSLLKNLVAIAVKVMPGRNRIFFVMLMLFPVFLIATAGVWEDASLLEKGPVEFLESLKASVGRRIPVTIQEPIRRWISERDIPALIERLDSQAPCLAVVDARSSFLPGISKEGDEAAFLIDGFRSGFYPPRLASRPYSRDEKAAIRNWWKDYLVAKGEK